MSVWKLERGTVEPSTYTKISPTGLLYVGLGQQAGTLIVKGGEEEDVLGSATVTVQVENVTTNPVNILADNSKTGSRQCEILVGTRKVEGGNWSLEKTHSTEIASDTTISSSGLLSWSRKQQSGQIAIKFEKDGVVKKIPVVFKKSVSTISPKTANLKNGQSQQFSIV